MSAILKTFTACSIGTALIVGVFACGVQLRFFPALIDLPNESVRLTLVPLMPVQQQPNALAPHD
jgi:hypothetical protein